MIDKKKDVFDRLFNFILYNNLGLFMLIFVLLLFILSPLIIYLVSSAYEISRIDYFELTLADNAKIECSTQDFEIRDGIIRCDDIKYSPAGWKSYKKVYK